ncbi:hypothetical protein AB0346_22950 [Nocardia beijingensis]|uniref:hypothetical protein n=1 Tax=Nocardia beijingensis TaxID=95162 RepID=UPI00344CA026
MTGQKGRSMLSLFGGWLNSDTAIWLEVIAAPLIVALAGVWYERSRRKTYRVILTDSASGTLLLDVRRGGRTLLLLRAADSTDLAEALRQLPAASGERP